MAVKIYDAYGNEFVRALKHPIVGSGGGIISQGTEMFDGQFHLDDPPDLKIRTKRFEVFRKMAETDTNIAETLRANSLPLITQATWALNPSREPEDPETLTPEEEASKKEAAIMEVNLYGAENDDFGRKYAMRPGWKQRLTEILRFLRNGFTLFHKTSHIVDGKRVYKKWTYLEPYSVVRWHTDIVDGELTITHIERQYRREDGSYSGQEFIGVEDLVLYPWDLVGMHAQGVPFIRPMYGSWIRKEWILRAKMVAAQRAGIGMPYAIRDPNDDGDDSKTTSDLIEEFLQSSLGKGGDTAYLSVANPSLKLQYLTQPPANLKVFDSLSAQEDLGIAHAGGTKLGMLGETPGGSRNVGEEQQALSYIMIEAIGEIIAELEKNGCGPFKGPIEELSEWNDAPDTRLPTLVVTNVDPKESVMNIPVLLNAKKSGMIKARPITEKMILDRLGFKVPKHILDSDPIEDIDVMGGPGFGPRDLNPERPGGGDDHRKADEKSKADDKSPNKA